MRIWNAALTAVSRWWRPMSEIVPFDSCEGRADCPSCHAAGRTYTCAKCQRVVAFCFGAEPGDPDWCDDCWRLKTLECAPIGTIEPLEPTAVRVLPDAREFPTESGADWTLINGDCIEVLQAADPASIDLSVYSPPFISLFTYTASERDIGNCKSAAEFFEHLGFMIRALLAATKPGRLSCVHVAQVPAMLERDGYIGLKDFRGKTIDAYEANGWIYHGEVCIDKDPQAQAIRTKSKALLFVQLAKDSSWLRPALADYVLVFRKPGENVVPIVPDITKQDWIEWARPIWYGIRESDTLQVVEARADEDERHICPLQLGTIERCIRLWSNPGDLVCSPFAGIGSEGYKAVQLERRFLGIELKPSYFHVAGLNLRRAESMKAQTSLFDDEALG